MKAKVTKEHKVEIDELQIKARELTEAHSLTKAKVASLEENMAAMIREMVNYYFDQRVEARLEKFVTADELKDKLKIKMDYALFCNYQKKRQEMEALDNKEFQLAEKFHNMQRQIEGLIDNNYLQTELKKKASSENHRDLKETVNQLKQNYETQSKLLNQKLSQTNDELVKKTNELMQNLHELHEKVKDLEEAPQGQHRRSRSRGRSRSGSPARN